MNGPARQNSLLTIITNPQSDVPLTLSIVIDTPLHRGAAISGRLIASGGTGGYVYSVSGAATSWLSVDGATGELSGTAPSTVGRAYFTGEVEDSSSTDVTASLSVDIVSRLSGGRNFPVRGEIGVPYEYQLTAAGATGTMTWAYLDGTVPAGLTVETDGLIDGTPTTPAGTSYFSLRGTDSGTGDTVDVATSILIYEALAVTFAELGDYGAGGAYTIPPMVQSVPYTLHAVVTGGGAPESLRFTFNLPSEGSTFHRDISILGNVATITMIDTSTALLTVHTTHFGVSVTDGFSIATVDGYGIEYPYASGGIHPLKNGSALGDPTPFKIDMVDGNGTKAKPVNSADTLTLQFDADLDMPYAQTSVQSGDTIANTTTETAFATAPAAFAANWAKVGTVLRLRASGVYSGQSLGSPAVTLNVYLGTTQLLSIVSPAVGATVTNGIWDIDAHLTVTAIGASGAIEAHGRGFFASSATAGVSVPCVANTAGITVATNVSKALAVKAQWSSAATANTIRMRQLVLERLDP